MSARSLLLIVASLALVGLGLSRVRLEANIFGLLPPDLPIIQSLQLYQEAFGGGRELIISMATASDEAAIEQAETLAAALSPHASSVVWRNPMRDDPQARAELLAWLWFNAPPEDFARFSKRFSDARIGPQLDGSLERIATALDPNEIGQVLMDPMGFTEIGRTQGALSRLAKQDPFASEDGHFRVLFVRAPDQLQAGFGAVDEWVRELHRAVDAWRSHTGSTATVKIGGTPAINAEFGTGIVGDMQLAATTTLLLVAVLFWLVHRRMRPLLWLSLLLIFVLAATIASGGLIFGTLNVISLGFAAILLGLAAGYGLLMYQEYAHEPGQPVSTYQRAIGPSIAWASATTAGAFLMVGRSSLPGMIELGLLVAMGIGIAAMVMVGAYLWPLAKGSVASGSRGAPRADSIARNRPLVWCITGSLLAGSGAAIWLSPPGVDPGTEPLGPRYSAARDAMGEIEKRIGGGNKYWVIIRGEHPEAVSQQLATVEDTLNRAVSAGVLDGYSLPTALWPRPDYQLANRETALWLGTRKAAFESSAAETGFQDDSLQLTDTALISLARFASGAVPVLPEAAGLRWLFQRFLGQDDRGQIMALGRLAPAAGIKPEALMPLEAELQSDTVSMASWQLASRSLLGTMKSDVARVVLPMIGVLLLLLTLAFRRVGDVILSVLTLSFSFVCLLGIMGLAGWSWNLMNVMALPLLLGVAVDYSIHVQLALQRHDGNVVQMQRTVGQAIVLAGATTAIGFGSLGLASNAGLASLGLVCASGVALTCAVSVFLLPVWWSAINRKELITT